MRLPHCVAIFYNLPWFRSFMKNRNVMRKMHAETGCVNEALSYENINFVFLYLGDSDDFFSVEKLVKIVPATHMLVFH
jgi:hypothetical protein